MFTHLGRKVYNYLQRNNQAFPGLFLYHLQLRHLLHPILVSKGLQRQYSVEHTPSVPHRI